MDNQQILLHHLLQKYLVERDINFLYLSESEMLTSNDKLSYLLARGLVGGGGGNLSRLVYLIPSQNFGENG